MHQTGRFYEEEGPVSGYFGKNVLDLDKMRSYMSEKAYNAVLASVKFGAKLDRSVSDEIAAGMKTWATEMGATHYTHLSTFFIKVIIFTLIIVITKSFSHFSYINICLIIYLFKNTRRN